MNRDRWSQVCELVADALEQPTAARRAWLADACDDPEILNEAESLLDQDATALAAVDAVPVAPRRAPEPRDAGQRVGPYRLIRELGRGGMGVVHLAERADGELERRVALKLLADGLGSAAFVERFRAERQILAHLDHPNVAGLYEGGTTADGAPYFAMEYVDGEPLDRWCDARRLPIRERLELFVTICRAVAFAHGRLVVHRDLKPSNILVTDDGVAKLLDFGIAKLLDPGTEQGVTVTATGVRPMTPAYASPEQILDRPITTATDTHALGVLLYEGLTGVRPFRPRRSASVDELRREICEREPPLPSTMTNAAVEGREPPEQRAGARSTTPRRLRHELRGDLDTIVAAALSVDGSRRYTSASQLADDLERHLAGLPVRARRPTVAYRVGKFLRRHARSTAAAMLVVLGLAGWLVDRGLQARRTEQALVRAERVTELMIDLFEVSDPSRASGAVTAADVLARGAASVRSSAVEDPSVRGALLTALGRAHHGLGLYDRAEALLAEAVDLHRRSGSKSATSDGLRALGLVRLARGDIDEAEATVREGLALVLSARRPDPLVVARHRHALADVLLVHGEEDTARDLYREVDRVRRELLDETHPERIDSLNDIAAEELASGDRGEAERMFREIVSLRRRLLGDNHPDVAKSLNNLASSLAGTGRHDEVASLVRQTFVIHREVFGPVHPDTLRSASILGQILANNGKFEEAEQLLRESLDQQRAQLGEDHQETILSAHDLATLLHQTGRHEPAAELLERAAASARRTYGPEHQRVATILNSLGVVRLALGDLDAALTTFGETLAVYEALGTVDSAAATSCLHNLGSVHRARGDRARAEVYYRRALELRQAVWPKGNATVANTQIRLARLLLEGGRDEESEALAREALATYRRVLPEGHWKMVVAQAALGAVLVRAGRLDEAQAVLFEARDVLDALPEVRPAVHELLTKDLAALDAARAKHLRSR